MAVDEKLSQGHPRRVAEKTTLADRVKSILDELSEVEGKEVSARELSRRAGFKSESHVGLLLPTKAGPPKVTNPTHETLRAIADVGNVELEWLSSGKPPRRRAAQTVERADRYTALAAVRKMAETDGYPPAFVAAFETHLDLDYQPTANDLWDMFKLAWSSEQRRLAKEGSALPPKVPDRGADPLAGLDDVPVRPARKNR